MKITNNRWLNTYDDEQFWLDVQTEVQKLKQMYSTNLYNSPHELYAVLAEELDEFWESVKLNNPDPEELMQLAAASLTGILWLSEHGRRRFNQLKENETTI